MIHIDNELKASMLQEHLRRIIPDGLAKIEFSVVDPIGWEEYLKTRNPEFLKNRIHSLQAANRINSPLTLAKTADRLCTLDPDQMRQATAEYETNLRRSLHP